MSDDETGESEHLSPKEMQRWMLQEIRDSAKAHELRVRDASAIATAYALGELTSEQAHEQFLRHSDRWGEALPGTHAFKNTTDEQVVASIDRAAKERSGINTAIVRRLGTKNDTSEPGQESGGVSR